MQQQKKDLLKTKNILVQSILIISNVYKSFSWETGFWQNVFIFSVRPSVTNDCTHNSNVLNVLLKTLNACLLLYRESHILTAFWSDHLLCNLNRKSLAPFSFTNKVQLNIEMEFRSVFVCFNHFKLHVQVYCTTDVNFFM